MTRDFCKHPQAWAFQRTRTIRTAYAPASMKYDVTFEVRKSASDSGTFSRSSKMLNPPMNWNCRSIRRWSVAMTTIPHLAFHPDWGSSQAPLHLWDEWMRKENGQVGPPVIYCWFYRRVIIDYSIIFLFFEFGEKERLDEEN